MLNGDRITQGQLLMSMWDQDQQARLLQAEAQLVSIGLAAGITPARHAAKMNPIDALRAE